MFIYEQVSYVLRGILRLLLILMTPPPPLRGPRGVVCLTRRVNTICVSLLSMMFDAQDRVERLDDLRRRVRDEPPAGGNAARIRLQLPNGSKVNRSFGAYCYNR